MPRTPDEILYAGKQYKVGAKLKGTMLTLRSAIKAKPGAGGGQLWRVECACGRVTKKRASALTGKRPVTTCGLIKCPFYSARKSQISRESNLSRSKKAKEKVSVKIRLKPFYDVQVLRAGANKSYDIWFNGEWKGWRSVIGQLQLSRTAVYQKLMVLPVGQHQVSLTPAPAVKQRWSTDGTRLAKAYGRSPSLVVYYLKKGFSLSRIEELFKEKAKSPYENLVDKNLEYLTSIGIIRPEDSRPQSCPCCSWKSGAP